MKRILITGAGSYIGMSVEKWLMKPEFAGMYQVDTVDMRGDAWKEKDFSGYDVVFHVAGIAHADIGKVTEEQKKLYYRVNCDLAVETAEKAKKSGVKQFIYMSSIIVYGEGTSIRKKRVITKDTKPSPSNFYGDSKWRAEQKLELLNNDAFYVAILRPPMIYGRGCKGNYQILSTLAQKLPIFPNIKNERSLLYIGNLCEFIRIIINVKKYGTLFPQNAEYVSTADIVRTIAIMHSKKIRITSKCNLFILVLGYMPGKIGNLMNKAFGSLCYDKKISNYEEHYQLYTFSKSIKLTKDLN